jgi:pyrroline-5-carboxylate reductase
MIAVIGTGNMGGAIINGLIKSESVSLKSISAFDVNETLLKKFASKGIRTYSNIPELVENADILLLAVKPHLIEPVLNDIKPSLKKNTTIISIAAGIFSEKIFNIIGKENPIVLCMPNTGISVMESMTCIASSNATEKKLLEIKDIFDKVGSCFIIEEKLIGAATAIAGCGPAFADRFIRAIMLAGTEMGFKPELALSIASQVLLGTAKALKETNNHPEAEIDKVTTPGGITITGLNEMEHNGFSSAVIKGLMKAHNKVK